MSVRYLDPKNDVAFKKLFSNKDRLINLLNAILKLTVGNKILDLDYIPQEQMPLFKSGKRSIFDLKVKDEEGRWYIVEMQRTMKIDFIDRIQFYGSYTYVTQIEQGIKHQNLLPIVVVSIIGTKMFPEELPYINYHQLKETTTNKQYLFSLTYVFIELGKFNANKIDSDVDQWLHLLKCAHEESSPPININNSSVLSAYQELEQYKWTANEHDAYIRSNLAMEKEEEELEDARLEGMEKGREEGIQQRNIEIAKEMLADGEPLERIMKFTKLTKSQITSLTS